MVEASDCAFFVRPSPQYRPEEDVELDVRYRLKFGQLSLNRPAAQEKEGMQKNLWPQESRTRNLTYSSSLFVAIEQTTYKIDPITNEEVRFMRYSRQDPFIRKQSMPVRRSYRLSVEGFYQKSTNECP